MLLELFGSSKVSEPPGSQLSDAYTLVQHFSSTFVGLYSIMEFYSPVSYLPDTQKFQ